MVSYKHLFYIGEVQELFSNIKEELFRRQNLRSNFLPFATKLLSSFISMSSLNPQLCQGAAYCGYLHFLRELVQV